jgi:hypothetical protein
MKKLIALGGTAILCLAGVSAVEAQRAPAKPSANSGQVCLQFNHLERWKVVNAKTLEITDKTNKKFRVAMNSDCAHSSFVDRVYIQRLGKSGLDCVEPGDRINLAQRNTPVERCLISSVSLYTDAQRQLDEKVNPSKP